MTITGTKLRCIVRWHTFGLRETFCKASTTDQQCYNNKLYMEVWTNELLFVGPTTPKKLETSVGSLMPRQLIISHWFPQFPNDRPTICATWIIKLSVFLTIFSLWIYFPIIAVLNKVYNLYWVYHFWKICYEVSGECTRILRNIPDKDPLFSLFCSKYDSNNKILTDLYCEVDRHCINCCMQILKFLHY